MLCIFSCVFSPFSLLLLLHLLQYFLSYALLPLLPYFRAAVLKVVPLLIPFQETAREVAEKEKEKLKAKVFLLWSPSARIPQPIEWGQ